VESDLIMMMGDEFLEETWEELEELELDWE
jgi:hypothetical protein